MGLNEMIIRLREFVNNEAKSCSMDFGCVCQERRDRYLFQKRVSYINS